MLDDSQLVDFKDQADAKIRVGILLINLGTPEAPTPDAVKRYLREFLMDPEVVQIPRPIWWLILNGVILRVRPKKSAEAYAKIWTDQGSPLMVYSRSLTHKLQDFADTHSRFDCVFELGMRYGNPSVAEAIDALESKGVEDILVLPLYPQYAGSSAGTAIKAASQAMPAHLRSNTIESYYDQDAYIAALAHSVERSWAENGRGQKLILSFHGVPQRVVDQGDPYLEHCTATARQLAERLELDAEAWQMVFQSRFGAEKWLQPYCVEVLESLPGEGIRDIDVICPGFAVDCLETLEEIAMQNRDLFMQAGGTRYQYIPALNDGPDQVEMMMEIIEDRLRSWLGTGSAAMTGQAG